MKTKLMLSQPEKVPNGWKHPFTENQASDPGDQASDGAYQVSDAGHQASGPITASNGQKLEIQNLNTRRLINGVRHLMDKPGV